MKSIALALLVATNAFGTICPGMPIKGQTIQTVVQSQNLVIRHAPISLERSKELARQIEQRASLGETRRQTWFVAKEMSICIRKMLPISP